MKKRGLLIALSLYFTYFVHGIGVSILSQYKEALSGAWQVDHIGVVLQVIAALGLGRLVALPLSGYLSDRFGRKISGLIGVCFYILYFLGMALTESAGLAYFFAVLGGVANSFLDTCVTPTILEIFKERGATANLFTKFSMSIGQFLLPFMIGINANLGFSYRGLFILMALALLIDGVLILLLPFPEVHREEGAEATPFRLKAEALPVILMGFTATATFTLWLNCNQELGALYGMADPSKIQSAYALGTILAILATAFVVLPRLETEDVLILYPLISLVALGLVFFIRTPGVATFAGFLIGYGGAGGVLQLVVAYANRYYPHHKGKITSVVMIASSVANYAVLALAGVLTADKGLEAPIYIVVLNMAITAASAGIGCYLKRRGQREN